MNKSTVVRLSILLLFIWAAWPRIVSFWNKPRYVSSPLGKGVLREAASLFRYKCGYVDEKGHAWVIRPQLDECRSFSENRNLAAVLVGSSWGFIDTSGVLRISAEYDDAGDFAEGLAPVKSSWFRGWGYINEEGRIVIPYRYKGAFSFDNGKAFVMEGGKKLYINNAGEVIEELKPAF